MEKLSPSELDDHAYLQGRTYEVTAQVRELLHRPLGEAALRIEQATDTFYPIREQLREFYTGFHVPYAYAAIPPNFFVGEPMQFTDQASFDTHMEDYWVRDERRYKYVPDIDRLTDKRKSIITAGLQRKLLDDPTPIDWQDWPDYSKYIMQLRTGDKTLMLNALFTAVSYGSAKDSGFFECAPGQHTSALVMRTSAALHDDSVGSLMRFPVLFDDISFTRRLMNATASMTLCLDTDRKLYDDLERLLQHDEYRAFFSKHVQRTTPDGGARDPNYGAERLQIMAKEGVQTVAGAMSFLLGEIPPSYDGGMTEFVNDIIDQDMVDKLARVTPFGLIGPAGFFGRYIPGLLYAQDGRKLRFTSEGLEALAGFSALVETEFAQLWRAYDALADPTAKAPIQAGRRCPFMGKHRNSNNPHTPSLGAISHYSRALGAMVKVFTTETEHDHRAPEDQDGFYRYTSASDIRIETFEPDWGI